jgi:hypothetical protein
MSKNTLEKVFLEPPAPPYKAIYKHNKVYCESILMNQIVY